ncbi:MAG: hypothetical protein C5B57_08665 [Blastocatellia bacterium]|nr:MAG: hypothetical protein C5B57_08665 [Blastocatellia bacterium]
MAAPDDRDTLAANLEMLERLLDTLTDVLDIRDVFDRISQVAQSVFPHDLLGVVEPSEDGTRLRLLASSAIGQPTFDVPIAPEDVDKVEWDVVIVHDFRERPEYAEVPAVKAGMLSMIGVPVRFGGRLRARVHIFSRQPGRFSLSDLPIAQRLASHVALAMSHHQLAEEAKQRQVAEARAFALQERAANLELLDDLLATLTEVLDIRSVFDRVSRATQRVLPHDVMGVLDISESSDLVRLHVTAGLPDGVQRAHEALALDPELLKPLSEPFVVDDVQAHPLGQYGPAAEAGLKSALSVPIRFGGRLRGAVNFLSREAARFSHDDLLIAKRIASHVALAMSHHHLSEEAHQRQVLEERASALALLDQSLASMSDVGTIEDIFARISTVAQPVLPHDALALRVLTADGRRIQRHASVGVDMSKLPTSVEITPEFVRDADWDHELVDDLAARPEPLNAILAEQGFRSVFRLLVQLEDRSVGLLAILSRTPSRYDSNHVQFARRIAARLATSLEHERVLNQKKRADEATDRAARLEARVSALTDELDARTGYRRVLGESASWHQVLTQATQVASTDTTVLLLGESGTGKEVVARFVHRASARKNAPFVALNCAALPEHLLEAELFGFERGAFTGATQSKPGQIEHATGGVLFLDEVGEMTLTAQAKFLRVLQEREFQRLGGNRVIRADVRVVAATNRDLLKAIERGTFREDLYYRLNVFPVKLPPLRDRREDILPMSEAFIQEIGRSLGRPPAGLARDARQALLEYHWPGNVRELRNMIERAAILADGGLIVRDHFAFSPTAPAAAVVASAVPVPVAIPADTAMSERAMIEKALQDARYNKAKAAKALGLTRAQLYVRLKRHRLE